MKHVLCERKPHHGSNAPHRAAPAGRTERRTLSPAAAASIRDAAREIVATLDDMSTVSPGVRLSLADPRLIDLIDARAAGLPGAVRAAVAPPATCAGTAIVSRLHLDDAELGPTPRDWREAAAGSGDPACRLSSLRLDIAMLLLARAAGEPFGWRGQQGGRLVNNIVPSPGHEHEQSGASSTTLLSPHTEDAFHPRRANLLLLGCLRNPDRVGTTASSVRQVRLDDGQRLQLARPHLPILPDVSYGTDFHRYPAAPVATIGDRDGLPTLRYDPAYTPLDDAGDEFRRAYEHLGAELERACQTAILEPGEVLLVDNDVVVHGRVPFTPRYDGSDRWLKRVNVRLPQRRRSAEDAAENGYGQETVSPFAATSRMPGRSGHTVPALN